MADEARELLKRLVACEDDSECPWEFRAQAFADTRALLAREQDGPVARGYVSFARHGDRWAFGTEPLRGQSFPADLPVPRVLWDKASPIVGSVVENQEGK